MTKEDVDHLYETFIPLQCDRVQAHSQLIPGVLEVVAASASQGYEPQSVVCTGDLSAGGRPGPWLALTSAIALEARAAWRCVKVDDTTPGIEEGINAGMWTVGLTLSGSLCGITQAEFDAMNEAQKQVLRAPAAEVLTKAGAHFVIDTVADLMPVLQQIDAQLRGGQRP
jgi:phosphonoacetaldehyde hydrolase